MPGLHVPLRILGERFLSGSCRPGFAVLVSWQLFSGYFERLLFSQAGPCGGGFGACRVRVLTGCHAGGDGEVPRVGVERGQLRLDGEAALGEQGAQTVCRRL